MARPRRILLLGSVGIVVGFSHVVGAGSPVELSATGYGGTETAHFSSCDGGAASIGAKYGGVGIEARLLPSQRVRRDGSDRTGRSSAVAAPADGDAFLPPAGFSASLAAASEATALRIESCSDDCAGFPQPSYPRTVARSAARLRLGYDWRYFGAHAGALLDQSLTSDGVTSFGRSPKPEIMVRIGPSDVAWGEIGFGSYNMPTMLRPGLYAGGGFAPAPAYSLRAHIGKHFAQSAPSADVTRFDVEARGPLSGTVQLGLGLAVSAGDVGGLHPEGRALIATEF